MKNFLSYFKSKEVISAIGVFLAGAVFVILFFLESTYLNSTTSYNLSMVGVCMSICIFTCINIKALQNFFVSAFKNTKEMKDSKTRLVESRKPSIFGWKQALFVLLISACMGFIAVICILNYEALKSDPKNYTFQMLNLLDVNHFYLFKIFLDRWLYNAVSMTFVVYFYFNSNHLADKLRSHKNILSKGIILLLDSYYMLANVFFGGISHCANYLKLRIFISKDLPKKSNSYVFWMVCIHMLIMLLMGWSCYKFAMMVPENWHALHAIVKWFFFLGMVLFFRIFFNDLKNIVFDSLQFFYVLPLNAVTFCDDAKRYLPFNQSVSTFLIPLYPSWLLPSTYFQVIDGTIAKDCCVLGGAGGG